MISLRVRQFLRYSVSLQKYTRKRSSLGIVAAHFKPTASFAIELLSSLFHFIDSNSKMCSKKTATSVHSDINAEIHDVPMNVLIRPIPPIVDEKKIQSLMNTLKDPETESSVPPIDVLWIKGSEGSIISIKSKSE